MVLLGFWFGFAVSWILACGVILRVSVAVVLCALIVWLPAFGGGCSWVALIIAGGVPVGGVFWPVLGFVGSGVCVGGFAVALVCCLGCVGSLELGSAFVGFALLCGLQLSGYFGLLWGWCDIVFAGVWAWQISGCSSCGSVVGVVF